MRPFEVRSARPEDTSDLVSLCLAARREASVGSQVCAPEPAVLAQQLGTLAAAPGGVVLVARSEEAAVGLLLGRVVGPSPFTDDVSLTVDALYVARDHRRRGVGHQLMQLAADVAAQAGAGHVYAHPVPGARGMQRFFVQLGFTPAAAYRVCTTAALQRRLAGEPVGRRTSARGLEELIARRRRSRTGGVAEALEVAPQAERRSMSMQVRRAVQTRREAASRTTIS